MAGAKRPTPTQRARDMRGMACGRIPGAAASPQATIGDAADSAMVCKTIGSRTLAV